MIRKLLITLAVLFLLPAFANAWYLNAKTSPSTGAGTIAPAGTQTYAAGSNSAEYAAVAAAGYTLSRVTLDGVTLPPNANGKYVAPFPSSATWRYMVAYFTPNSVTITTQVTGGSGIIREDTYESLTDIPLGSSRQLLVIPSAGYSVASVTAAGATITSNGDGSRNVVYSNLQSSKSVSASFSLIPVISVSAGNDVSTVGQGAEFAVTLSGSATSNLGAISYAWSGAGLSFGTPGAAVTTAYSATPGSYTATLTVTSGGVTRQDSTLVTVRNRVEYLNGTCTGCHLMNTTQIMLDYNNSLHPGKVSCQDCHTDAPHTGLPTSSPCINCHTDTSGNVAGHPLAIEGNPCLSCHRAHSTAAYAGAPAVHYNNYTGAGYPASYMTTGALCTNCHVDGLVNNAIRSQWAASGHAQASASAWSVDDFKTRSGCVQCHTTTGFIAYSSAKASAAWGVAADKTKELLTCIGCHSDITTGALRAVAPVRPFADDPQVNRNVGKSNICMGCHSGTNNGASITAQLAASADFSDLAFIAPHYLTAAGTVYAKSGYHFAGQSYSADSKHGEIGALDAAGPCVSCHKNESSGHSFKGEVTPLCAGCHGTLLDAARLDADRAAFADVLLVLRAQLAAKGFAYTAGSFEARNWGAGQAGADSMGAAFNYALLATEPGAYAHNPEYARELALDSIDYLDNGQLDDSVAGLAVPALYASGAISQAVADSFAGYNAKDRCITCHGGSSATASPMASSAHWAHITALYGPGAYLGSGVSSCQACHLSGDITHMNGMADLLNGAGSSCRGCHAGAAPAWIAARLSCTVCHSATPARLPNGVAAPFKANFAGSGHGQYALCTDCHDSGSRHISGSLGSYNRLSLPNDNNLCASCHNEAYLVGAAQLNMLTHVNLSCRDCHDPHGTANPGMIRSTVNGSAISFTEVTYGLIDTATNRGLCQVCHTLTAHYRAGVPETDHYSTACLSCHTHNSAGGAFRPIAGGSCDGCHGYPPAPRSPAVSFGTLDNWANARFEDYSGGGGAHLVGAHIPAGAKASEGWTNCTLCHNDGGTGTTPYHKMVLPIKSHIDNVTVLVDPKLRFSEGFTVYTGAKLQNAPAANVTGSCYNISCHMSPSPRWSTER